MKLTETKLEGVFIIDNFHAEDQRGHFIKTLHQTSFEKYGLEAQFKESFYSVNNKGVIRGMHFQIPPDDHVKLVYCNAGSLIDVVLDIRNSSPTYGNSIAVELSGTNHRSLYIPRGLAHGFETLEDQTIMTYLTSTEHSPNADAGILYNSFEHQWLSNKPILSDRDKSFTTLENFKSPFV
jgi:dTDP-4-dehydrorhamnose 3,5-epimerase/CDP-3, 6-dideoxy-D-glycero-D-glycero-4-hexulose-5-epimerase